jgi:hypothetical protein
MTRMMGYMIELRSAGFAWCRRSKLYGMAKKLHGRSIVIWLTWREMIAEYQIHIAYQG